MVIPVTSPPSLQLELDPLRLWYCPDPGSDSRVEIDPLWLREHCQDPDHRDPRTRQRLFNPHQLPIDIALTQAHWQGSDTLWLEFSDGYRGGYDLSELLFDLFDFMGGDGCPPPEPWQTGDWDRPEMGFRFPWPSLDVPEGLRVCLDRFLRSGFVVVSDTETDPDSILTIARRFGHIRETNFGQLFEIYSRAGGNDLAYSTLSLDPHTDNPYREPVPGIQVLHCLINDAMGGLSTLVDGLAAAEALQQEDPEGFALLARIPVRFRFVDPDQDLLEWRPIIQLDPAGQIRGIHYSPRLDSLPHLPTRHESRRYHRARQRLGHLLTDPQFELRFKLASGDLLMFDNQRLLHGRTSFDPSTGHRHLQGCYIDHDGPRSRYRVLMRSRLGSFPHLDPGEQGK